MTKNPNSIHQEESNKKENTLDSTDKSAIESLRTLRQQQIEKAPKEAAHFFKNIYDLQKDFAHHSQAIKEANSTMSQQEFEKWEDAFTDEYNFAQKTINYAHLDLDTIAEAAQNMITSSKESELRKTIEAQAGNFYYERVRDLKKAINDSKDPNSEKDIDYILEFRNTVYSHLDYKYMTPEEVKDYGPEQYERQRTHTHNSVIEHINGLNSLANKYNTRPFTVRNFWPSSIRNKNEQSGAMQKVLRYDRDIVEEYYAVIFSDEVRKREANFERKRRYGLI